MTNQTSNNEYFEIAMPVKYFKGTELIEFLNLLGVAIRNDGENITVKTENEQIVVALKRLKAKRILENIF